MEAYPQYLSLLFSTLENVLYDGYTGLDVSIPLVFLKTPAVRIRHNPFQTSGVMSLSRVRSCPIHQSWTWVFCLFY